MCGRFAATSSSSRLAERFEVDEISPEAAEIPPSWNVAPGTPIRAVLDRSGVRTLEALRWGLLPSWAKSPATGAKMINARAETLRTSGAYRGPLARRRAIVPMDGFYEWRSQSKGSRQPYYFSAPNKEPLAVAGLWDAWRYPDGTWLLSTTIITMAASGPVAAVHDRMPVVLASEVLDAWLDCADVGADDATNLLRAPWTDLRHWPVGRAVNRIANDDPELVAPIPS